MSRATMLLAVVAIALVAAVAYQALRNRTDALELKSRITELTNSLGDLEKVSAERDRNALERDEAREGVEERDSRIADLTAERDRLLADLERTGAERDLHLEIRLALERRLEDALALLSAK